MASKGSIVRALLRLLPEIIRLFQKSNKPANKPAPHAPRAPTTDRRDRDARIDAEMGRATQPKRDPKRRREPPAGDGGISRLFDQRRSDTMVEGEGTVVHVLPDDLEGDRHQRLLVEVTDDRGRVTTIKISHNIDLADRVPADDGDRIRFKGEYEWNDLGGCVHWTHHDPKGWHEDGWVEANGVRVG